MAEYPPRACGPCPNLPQVESNPGKSSNYLTQNTVSQTQSNYQNAQQISEDNSRAPKTYQSPELQESPINQANLTCGPIQNSFKEALNKKNGLLHQNIKDVPPCAEVSMKKCCLEKNDALKQLDNTQIDCEVFNKKGSIKTPKGILKGIPNNNCCCPNSTAMQVFNDLPTLNQDPQYSKPECLQQTLEKPVPNQLSRMHTTKGPQGLVNPENLEMKSYGPTPNELTSVSTADKPACYLPQPEDAIMAQKIAEMGPVGPWATGKADWGPLGGLTGTRPVVDKYSITRYSEGEWRTHNKEVLDKTISEQHRANLIDWNGRQCLEQTQSDVDKNQEDNTKRLNQREMEIMRWKCELERAIALAAEEISFLEEQRHRLKQAASVLQMPESIAGECLERKAGRLDTELVRDDVETELIKEVALCSEIRDIFSRVLKDVELQMLENRTAKQRLEYDWSDKIVAHGIDALNSSLNTRSTILMFKPAAVIFPDNQSTPEYWEHFTKETLLAGEATRQRSVALRGTLDAILMNAARDLRTQADRVELALNKKVACTEEILRKLENELKQLLRKLADVEDLMNSLKATIRRIDIPMKKAQTRLDNRLLRPRVENCRDPPHFGLIDEVKSISENVAALHAQLGQAQKSEEQMINIRNNLEREIMLKRKTLEIDRDRIRVIRSHYPSSTALSGY
ncbi:hypothetical protein ABEB36_013511 [Hypothenemus hampei]|uniref:Tektin n=1 Tax=Hypothenemus hampei TaxID=57062 RepID=A0ABD1E4F7_HYPHA